MVRWRDRTTQPAKVRGYVRPTESAVELNIESHRLLSDVCVCVSPYLKTSGSGPITSWEMVGISCLNSRSDIEE